jgi:methionine synthase I (cobalamin-dependent)
MAGLLQQLAERGPIVTDGAWGTQLQALGLAPGDFPDAWNLSFPERVEQVGRSYVTAGSRIILTNTFGANRIRLREFGLEEKVGDINRVGVEISRRAAHGEAIVFASMGPTGKLLMDSDVTADQMHAAFEEQAEVLRDAGAEAIVVETMSDLEEAALAVDAVHRTGLPVVACMVFDSGKEGDRTMMGITPEQAAQALIDAGADAIGANCGQGIAGFSAICQRLHAATGLPIWLKPNAGLPRMVNGQPEYSTCAEEFASYIPRLLASGATFIGGCCGTSPAFIEAIRKETRGD